jgi:AcrR family transcriptional regulator
MRRRPKRSLPASLEAAWGIRDRPAKGPKPTLNLDRIVEAAVKVASSRGLAAVSMSRIAGQLGAGTMALYRYVGAKEELLALMVDSRFQDPPASSTTGEGWRAGLSRWAREHRAVLRRHPWIVQVPLSGPPLMPNEVVWFERALSCLTATGLTETEKISALLLVNGFVRNEATLTADLQKAARAASSTMEKTMSDYGTQLGRLIDPQRFPAIASAIASGVFDQPDAGDMDADFEFGLERILDGIEVLVRERSSHR